MGTKVDTVAPVRAALTTGLAFVIILERRYGKFWHLNLLLDCRIFDFMKQIVKISMQQATPSSVYIITYTSIHL